MQDLSARILNYFAQSGVKPIRPKELAYELKVGKKDYSEFKAAVEQLLGSGRLSVGKNKQLRARNDPTLLTGTIKRSARGFGYFRPDEPLQLDQDESLYIAPEDLKDAYTGDEVQVQLLKRRMKGKRCGRVVAVLSRASTAFVGTYFEKRNYGFVRIEGGQFESAISVGDPGAKGARPEDQVVVEILRFPSPTDAGEAVITKVLGPRGTPGVDLLTIIHEFGLPDEFPESVLAEARLQAQKFEEEVSKEAVTSDELKVTSEEEPGRASGSSSSLSPRHSLLLPSRLDLTGETIITIDPIDARDFDDAISLSRDDDGTWRLGVHIADVAHFVQPGTMLDKEARNRGTSVYLPDKVLPMLPEVISNALASLQQGRVRYTKSAFITFSPEGTPLHSEFANTMIMVTRRFAYEQVMPILEGLRAKGQGPSDDDPRGVRRGSPDPAETADSRSPTLAANVPPVSSRRIEEETCGQDGVRGQETRAQRATRAQRTETRARQREDAVHHGEQDVVEPRVLELLQNMHELAMVLRRRRFQRGALNLDLPEVKIDMDRGGKVTGAHVVAHDESHEIIEEFMLAANIAVATKLADCGMDFLRRTHAPPDERKLRALSEFVASLGYKIRPMPGRGDLQKLLKEVQGTPHEYAVSYAVLRSTKRAEYNPDPDIGHYALSEANYCHFTSPIRRYPDLTIHRLLDEVISAERGDTSAERGTRNAERKRRNADESNSSFRAPSSALRADLVSLGKWCSQTERRADDAEKELVKLKMLEYLAERIGEELDATITGVERFGLFCMGIQLPAEGLIHITTLPDDNYDYDDRAHTLVGRRSGRVFRLGGTLRVVVAAVDLVNRNLEFKLVTRGQKKDERESLRQRRKRGRDQ